MNLSGSPDCHISTVCEHLFISLLWMIRRYNGKTTKDLQEEFKNLRESILD